MKNDRMVFISAIITVFFVIFSIASPGTASAQEQIKPRILVLVDTSGSMAWDISGFRTNGDGSSDPWNALGSACCPGAGGSRMYIAKESMRQMIRSAGDVEFALMKFPQRYLGSSALSACDDCETIQYRYNQSQAGMDRLRYYFLDEDEYTCTFYADFSETNRPNWLCVGFDGAGASRAKEIVSWMDHHEFSETSFQAADVGAYPGPHNDSLEQELRAEGYTPLGEAIRGSHTYFGEVMAADMANVRCRPYSLLVLSDGDPELPSGDPAHPDEECPAPIDPVAEVTALYDIGQDPTYFPAGSGTEAVHVRTWVVGLAHASQTLDDMALSGGTTEAYSAYSEEALSEILYTIISESILVESCNYADDDCDGLTDEGFTTLYCDVHDVLGPDHPEVNSCADPGETECDGIDDNCDGETDEGTWPAGEICGGCDPLEADCTADPNEGECQQGESLCVPGVGWDCLGGISPALEICDNRDNDCDGLTDEEVTGGPCGETDAGECTLAAWSCAAGEWSCAAITPLSEGDACDSKDNDCDGATDEGISNPCGGGPVNGGTAICRPGVQHCNLNPVSPGFGACENSIEPREELCNRLDDNCNGDIDEGLLDMGLCGGADPTGCSGFEGNLCPDGGHQGECTAGVLSCVSGIATCVGDVVVPTAELCDGLDNDCDGETDEQLQRACQTLSFNAGVGICEVGVQTCRQTKWGSGDPWTEAACTGERGPAGETCNGLDDDCDAATDEDLTPPVGEACSACGVWACVGGRIICQDNTSPETCDGMDNDCNGFTDEGLFQYCGGCDSADHPDRGCTGDPSQGSCQQGIRWCQGGAWADCVGDIDPQNEVCDGKDNDCDGLTDEEVEGIGVVCGSDQGICEPGIWRCADDSAGGMSIQCCADTIDAIGCVPPQGPQLEACNAVDDDCDGLTDEGLPGVGESCGIDQGVCKPGTYVCQCGEGAPAECEVVCIGGTIGTDEVCNGLDDDCNGFVDDGLPLGAACSRSPAGTPVGYCQDGFIECVDGEMQCNAPSPQDEICDGVDNDCDGVTDENLIVECPTKSLCIAGACAEPCVGQEFACPSGERCETKTAENGLSTRVCITDVCTAGRKEALPCTTNPNWCSEGYAPPCKCDPSLQQCVGICHVIVCPEGTACVPQTGTCHRTADNCYASGCPQGERCTGGVCEADPCADKVCAEGLYCNETGVCTPSCLHMDCPRACVDGQCVDLCATAACTAPATCNPTTGRCERPDACDRVNCKFFEICEDGNCIVNPCWNTSCPNGLACMDGHCGVFTDEGDISPDGGAPGSDISPFSDTELPSSSDGDYPSSGMTRVLATGAGGCLCSGAPGMSASSFTAWPVWAMGLLLAFFRLSRRMRRWRMMWIPIAALVFAAACDTRPYVFETDTGGTNGTDSTSGNTTDNPAETGSESESHGACTPGIPDDDCDGIDDDCDNRTDEDADLLTDVNHCGACGTACQEVFPHAIAACAAGKCAIAQCAMFYSDVNDDPMDGCEHYCRPTAQSDMCNGVDLGDGSYVGVDDDCDGQTDEDVNIETSTLNCGRCGNPCRGLDAEAGCAAGQCQITACTEGYFNADGVYENGCEYACVPAAEVELCNHRDDNCDGQTDEGNPQAGVACYAEATGCTLSEGSFTCLGICSPGTYECQSGALECIGEIGPTLMEACNGLDEDCDGITDEDVFRSCSNQENNETGICHLGLQACVDGEWGACSGEATPLTEVCDGLDNDCDGVTDNHLTGFGLICSGAEGSDPNQGACQQGSTACIDGSVVCEGGVGPTPEDCDGQDNDCDGETDETLTKLCVGCDPALYPSCVNPAEGECQQGIQTCNRDASPPAWTACEGSVGPIDEVCDGYDNDCDGLTDADDSDIAVPADICNPLCPGTNTPVCTKAFGWQCDYACDNEGGPVACDVQGQPMPVESVCDGQDNNCDGETDEGLTFTMESCGACGYDCNAHMPAYAFEMACYGGQCEVVTCTQGHADDVLTPGDDCACLLQNGGQEGSECNGADDDCDGLTDEGMVSPEVCDGIDNNCDGATDEDLILSPGLCNPLCPGDNVPACIGGEERCDYRCLDEEGSVECTEEGEPALIESLCDGEDNNCDGTVDDLWTEGATGLKSPCDNSGTGGCRQEGVYRCAADLAATVCCDLAKQSDGAVCVEGNEVTPPTVGEEGDVHDGLDNDCDGATDEGIMACVHTVHVAKDEVDFNIMAYEASRPDATNASSGTMETAACSEPSLIPWTSASFDEAQAACLALNDPDDGVDCDATPELCWNLCSADQWQYACEWGAPSAAEPHLYPYGDDPELNLCNSEDYEPLNDRLLVSGLNGTDACDADWGAAGRVVDLSGNAEEWTRSFTDQDGVPKYQIRGGSYNDLPLGLTCDFDAWTAPADYRMPNLGFRCCQGNEPEAVTDTCGFPSCAAAISAIANHPFDFEDDPSGCTDEGWRLSGEWEAGVPSWPASTTSCVLATDTDGNYDANAEYLASSAPMNLECCIDDPTGVTLRFKLAYAMEHDFVDCNYDWGHVQVFDGTTWVVVTPTQGYVANGRWCAAGEDWMEYTADVSPYMGPEFRVMFRLHSDYSVEREGMYIDDVTLENASVDGDTDTDADTDADTDTDADADADSDTDTSPPAPKVDDLAPFRSPGNAHITTTITGEHFVSGAKVHLVSPEGTLMDVTSYTFVNGQTMTATMPTLSQGAYPLRVTNPDGQYGEYYYFGATSGALAHLGDFLDIYGPPPLFGDPSLLTARWRHASVEGFDPFLGSFIYSAGGLDSSGTVLDDVEILPIAINGEPGQHYLAEQWDSVAGVRMDNVLSTPRHGLALVRVGSWIYALGGANVNNLAIPAPGAEIEALTSVERAEILGHNHMPRHTTASMTGAGSLPAGIWYYRVSAVGAWGESLPSTAVRVDTASSGAISFSWDPVSGADGYNVYRNQTATGNGGLTYLSAETGTTTYADNGTLSVDPAIAPLPPGSLGLWQEASSMTTQREGLGAVAIGIAGTKTRQIIYAIGGRETNASVCNQSQPDYLRTIEVAEVQDNGSLSPFVGLASVMSTPRAFFQLLTNLGQDAFIGPTSDPGEGPLETGGEVGDLMLIAVLGDKSYCETDTGPGNLGLKTMEISRIIKENGALSDWTLQDFEFDGKDNHAMGAELFFDHLFVFAGVDTETYSGGPLPSSALPKRVGFFEDAADDLILTGSQGGGSKLVTDRTYYGMVRLNGYIYALGGNDGDNPLDTIEMCLQ